MFTSSAFETPTTRHTDTHVTFVRLVCFRMKLCRTSLGDIFNDSQRILGCQVATFSVDGLACRGVVEHLCMYTDVDEADLGDAS